MMDHEKKFRSLEDLAELSPQNPDLNIPAPHQHDGKGKRIRVILDTHGRKGKNVTVVIGLQHNLATMEDIAQILKQHCGAGGTVKEGKIEIQGDQRERIAEELKTMNYLVK